jgi:hypothetical protein
MSPVLVQPGADVLAKVPAQVEPQNYGDCKRPSDHGNEGIDGLKAVEPLLTQA